MAEIYITDDLMMFDTIHPSGWFEGSNIDSNSNNENTIIATTCPVYFKGNGDVCTYMYIPYILQRRHASASILCTVQGPAGERNPEFSTHPLHMASRTIQDEEKEKKQQNQEHEGVQEGPVLPRPACTGKCCFGFKGSSFPPTSSQICAIRPQQSVPHLPRSHKLPSLRH